LALAIVLLVLAFGGGGGSILPVVNPKPIKVDGFTFLVLTDRSVGTIVANPVLRDASVQSYIASNVDEWHSWDDSHTDFEYVEQPWQDAYAKAKEDAKGELPWVLVSGKGGTSERMPDEPQAFLELLGRYKP